MQNYTSRQWCDISDDEEEPQQQNTTEKDQQEKAQQEKAQQEKAQLEKAQQEPIHEHLVQSQNHIALDNYEKPPLQREVCKYWIIGKCKFSALKCKNYHPKGECRYWKQQTECPNGDKCEFYHGKYIRAQCTIKNCNKLQCKYRHVETNNEPVKIEQKTEEKHVVEEQKTEPQKIVENHIVEEQKTEPQKTEPQKTEPQKTEPQKTEPQKTETPQKKYHPNMEQVQRVANQAPKLRKFVLCNDGKACKRKDCHFQHERINKQCKNKGNCTYGIKCPFLHDL